MIIDLYEIPNTLVLNYCRVIRLAEAGNTQLETARKILHTKIFEAARCNMSLFRREDRQFNLALNNTVIELIEDMEE